MISILPPSLSRPTIGSYLGVMSLCLLLGTSSPVAAQFDAHKAERMDPRPLVDHGSKPHVVYEVDWKRAVLMRWTKTQIFATGEVETVRVFVQVTYDPTNPYEAHLHAKMFFLSNPGIPSESVVARILIPPPDTFLPDFSELGQILTWISVMQESFQSRIEREYEYGELIEEFVLEFDLYEDYRFANVFASESAARDWIRGRGFPYPFATHRIREATLEY